MPAAESLAPSAKRPLPEATEADVTSKSAPPKGAADATSTETNAASKSAQGETCSESAAEPSAVPAAESAALLTAESTLTPLMRPASAETAQLVELRRTAQQAQQDVV